MNMIEGSLETKVPRIWTDDVSWYVCNGMYAMVCWYVCNGMYVRVCM